MDHLGWCKAILLKTCLTDYVGLVYLSYTWATYVPNMAMTQGRSSDHFHMHRFLVFFSDDSCKYVHKNRLGETVKYLDICTTCFSSALSR